MRSTYSLRFSLVTGIDAPPGINSTATGLFAAPRAGCHGDRNRDGAEPEMSARYVMLNSTYGRCCEIQTEDVLHVRAVIIQQRLQAVANHWIKQLQIIQRDLVA